jgi:hypothetical protein
MFRYIQSPQDVPARVDGGPKGLCRVPSLQVGKWDEEAYLRVSHAGERVRKVERNSGTVTLTTNRRRHVFRHLDEGHFEYDVVLDQRPSQPEVILPLEFPRGLSFYKQRPTGRDDLVSGSYAVYWRGRNNRYRTGKLCHIYRPKILDDAGRWIWGELDFDGENLVISMDERWLKRARYPVTVDPIVGTSTVGAKHLDESDPDPEEWYDLCYEMVMPVNRYTAPAGIRGVCTARAYAYKNDPDAQGYPVLYAESGGAPAEKLSSSEALLDMRSPGGGSWISASFNVETLIPAGTPLWFGVMPFYMLYPYYDDGGDIEEMETYAYSSPPATFSAMGGSTARILSMYFEFAAAADYSATLSSGVSVGDSEVTLRGLGRTVADGVAVGEAMERWAAWRRVFGDDGGMTDGLVRRVGRFLRLTDAPVLWDWTGSRRVLGLVVRKLVSRITRVLNLESRIGDGED